jgi:TonB dependent receptor-like, beta-barrel/Carboxypeptidase regulatory-like domain
MTSKRRYMISGLLIVTWAALLPMYLHAQASAEIKVTRASDHQPLAKVKVTFVKPGTSFSTTGVTDDRGLARILAIDAGEYQLKTEASGYFPVRYQIVLAPRQTLALAVELTTRERVQQEVEVQGSVADLNTQQTGTSTIVTQQTLEQMPAYLKRDVQNLAQNLMPGAVLSHDNFIHVRGNELSLHEFINGVSFLDNSHQHFTPGISPAIFESANLITGGFPAEFGNRFGGILDITTRSGRSMNGHGSISAGAGTVLNHDLSAEYGGSKGQLGYYAFAGGYTSDRFLNPPVADELHDFGHALRSALQLDYQRKSDSWKLFVTGGATTFQLPNTEEQEAVDRDASRRLRSQTAILSWQHTFSPNALVATSVYERTVSDHLIPTSDPFTQIGEGSRSTLSAGIKSDLNYAVAAHTFKAGVDLTRLRSLESFRFDPQGEESELDAFTFNGGVHGGQVSAYAQDHFTLVRNLTLDLGVRWDQFDLVDTFAQVSPRLGVAYSIPATHSVVHFSYNRFFSPPPIEYQLLASFIGANNPDPELQVGDPKAYRQHYFEAGWSQQVNPKVLFEVNAYYHKGDNSFENGEIGNTRLFVPTNFAHARARGAEATLNFRELDRVGISGRIQYTYARVRFIGPIVGGLADEALEPGEEIAPAFDQTHSVTAGLTYHNRWHGFWTGTNYRYGTGTPVEGGLFRLPVHSTVDIAAGIAVWQREPERLDFEFDLTNVSDNRYQIAKESELTPIQFAPRRVASGRLKWRF